MMEPRYAQSYVQEVVRERDGARLYQLLSVLARRATLPDELWAFNRVMEWIGATRSGVWQYYEGIDPRVFERLRDWFSRVGWQAVYGQYNAGMAEFSAGGNCAELDRWLDEHDDVIMADLWQLAAAQIEWLKATASTA